MSLLRTGAKLTAAYKPVVHTVNPHTNKQWYTHTGPYLVYSTTTPNHTTFPHVCEGYTDEFLQVREHYND